MRAKLVYLALLFLLLTAVKSVRQDFFSSTVGAPQLVQTHDHLVRLVRKFSEAMVHVNEVLNRFLQEEDISYVSEPWPTDGDPLRTYHLIRRTSFDVNQIVDTIRFLRANDPLLELQNLHHARSLPKMEDFRGIAQALVRLQKVYGLDTVKLARGEITDEIHLPVQLSAADCLFLGQTAEYQDDLKVKENMAKEAALWYEAGLILTMDDPTALELKSHFHKELARIYSQNPTGLSVDDTTVDFRPSLMDVNITWDEVLNHYHRLCRGETLRPPVMDAGSSCHVSHGPHPYLKLRPLKVEELSLEPYLVMIHDIINEGEIERLKEEALPLMERSSHVGGDDGSETSELRVSSTSWIEDYQIPSLTNRLEAVTGMVASSSDLSAELYQVLNYGVGGHYTPHYDYFENRSQDPIFERSGDRLATLMIYLSDVEAGGATAFPYLGITVWPRKGSAAFWWNLRPSGHGEPLTTHGACPVLYGTKWVTNKWFRTHPQMFQVPCDPNQQTSMPRL